MCGISGIFDIAQNRGELKKLLEDSLLKLEHRGPDYKDFSEFDTENGILFLGHTRLSIIDLSDSANQPMYSFDGKYHLVFNGEIYNYKELRKILIKKGYKFNSESDTEVLLNSWHYWGVDCIELFEGMFAFAIFDIEERKLFCVRDAYGIKPLFYKESESGFKFASEIDSLSKLIDTSLKPNLKTGFQFLSYGRYDNSKDTFFEGIYTLLPGHILTYDLNENRILNIKRWWNPDIDERKDIIFSNAADILREKFLKSVKLHLRSDVALGVSLSGGIDSSAIVSAMRYLEPDMPIHTFSYLAKNKAFNEEKWVDVINNYVDSIPHKVFINPDDIFHDLDDMISCQGEPFSTTNIYAQYRVFKEARDNGITVVLGGQGADECLGGYFGYPEDVVLSLLEKREYGDVISYLNNWAKLYGTNMITAYSYLLKNIVPDNILKNLKVFRDKSIFPKWINQNFINNYDLEFGKEVFERKDFYEGRRLMEALRNDLTNSRIRRLLRYEDRNSMRWSIESRVPFLNKELIEFLLSLPEEFLVSKDAVTKNIFRASMRGIVPDEILNRSDKIGYQTPQHEWLVSMWPSVKNWINETDLLPWINKKSAIKEIDTKLKDNNRMNSEVWRFINYCKWCQICLK